eukprot:tig00000042_g15579.t2
MCEANAVAPSAGLALCQICPAGQFADDARRTCKPCPAGTRMPEGSLACEKCEANSISGPGSVSCAQCEAGFMSDDGLACAACPPGTYRNTSMLGCTPCPLGTYASGNGSAACLPCPPQTLCPVATSTPHSVDLSTFSSALRVAPGMAESASRRLLRSFGRPRRRTLEYDEDDVELKADAFEYGTNTGTITQPVVKTEEEVLKQTNTLFAIIGAGAVGGTALVGIAVFLYLRVLPASTPESRAARYRQRIEQDAQRTQLQKSGDPDKSKGIQTTPAAATSARTQHLKEPWATTNGANSKSKSESAAGGESGSDSPVRTISGAIFTLLAIVAVGVALCFVVVQFAIANHSIVQRRDEVRIADAGLALTRSRSLNPGVSPTAASIAGTFAFSATFRGYRGACATDLDASVEVTGFSGAQSLSTAPFDAGASCNMTWTCTGCRIASVYGATATLRLSSRLAYAVSIIYTIKVPEFVTAEGFVQTAREDTVFRGSAAVPLPVALTPMHFTSKDDVSGFTSKSTNYSPIKCTHQFIVAFKGRPRYFAALSLAEAGAAERGLDTFALCSPTRPLTSPECSDESVAAVAAFRVAEVYVLVDRKLRSTVLDAIANAASLAGVALGAAGQVLVAYLFVKNLLAQRTATLQP